MASTALRNNDGVARLEVDVLPEILAVDDVLVVEAVADLTTFFHAHHDDFFGLREVTESSSGRDELEHGGRSAQGIRTRLRDFARDVDLAAVDLADDDRHGR